MKRFIVTLIAVCVQMALIFAVAYYGSDWHTKPVVYQFMDQKLGTYDNFDHNIVSSVTDEGTQVQLPASLINASVSNTLPFYDTRTKDDIRNEYCLAEALYWEARNQSEAGMLAVGAVILNRVSDKRFPNTICGVVHQGPADGSRIRRHKCQFSYYCDGKSDKPLLHLETERMAWEISNEIASMLASGNYDDITKGSTFYHTNYVKPHWRKAFTVAAIVDSHIFYTR